MKEIFTEQVVGILKSITKFDQKLGIALTIVLVFGGFLMVTTGMSVELSWRFVMMIASLLMALFLVRVFLEIPWQNLWNIRQIWHERNIPSCRVCKKKMRIFASKKNEKYYWRCIDAYDITHEKAPSYLKSEDIFIVCKNCKKEGIKMDKSSQCQCIYCHIRISIADYQVGIERMYKEYIETYLNHTLMPTEKKSSKIFPMKAFGIITGFALFGFVVSFFPNLPLKASLPKPCATLVVTFLQNDQGEKEYVNILNECEESIALDAFTLPLGDDYILLAKPPKMLSGRQSLILPIQKQNEVEGVSSLQDTPSLRSPLSVSRSFDLSRKQSLEYSPTLRIELKR